ncbi:uracil-DNA glycosylase [Halococcoides cellulosivorans]|uniref:Type-4 uracil-DNA glycosylase n=1 Tax=Halococcoides cellulosivorans TaxID=1679096 RepID=A0A2R4X0H2_9EURY|nr:uracil-DNA glycosylase [Halococcoides cellulosivorans]AWB27298.1 uracil-DNA glycosylase [Halococcoides cellulosivorans]
MDDCTVDSCRKCDGLVASRSRIVNGVGPTDADLVFVGEAPGEQEDSDGEPFVGRSGSILDEALRDAGAERAAVRITNAVRCRPPDNRDPRAGELAACRDHLDAELAAIDPRVTVALGKVPAEHLLGRSVAVTSEAGSVETVALGGQPRDVMISVHPAATLYDRSQRDTFDATIANAVEIADIGSDQASIADF